MHSSMTKMIHFLHSGRKWEVEPCNESLLREPEVRLRISGSTFSRGIIAIKFLGRMGSG